MSKIYVTSDTHFDHFNIIRFAGRPFKDLVNMNSHMLDMWIRTVQEEDTIYFLGDFAFGPDSSDDRIAQYLSLLSGNVKFLIGNHDEPRFGKGVEQIIKDYKFDIEVIPAKTQITVEGQVFQLSHYGIKTHEKEKDIIYLNGHYHSQFKFTKMHDSIQGRKYDIGIDMYGGPVQITGDCRYLSKPKGWRQ